MACIHTCGLQCSIPRRLAISYVSRLPLTKSADHNYNSRQHNKKAPASAESFFTRRSANESSSALPRHHDSQRNLAEGEASATANTKKRQLEFR